MKKGTQINIDGKSFTYKGFIKDTQITRGKSIYECYNRPSYNKECIYIRWKTWALENNGWLDIASYNTHMFTLKGIIRRNNEDYYLYITKTRQEIYSIEY